MTDSEEEHTALFVKPEMEVLGVLTGQVPVRSMPIAGQRVDGKIVGFPEVEDEPLDSARD